MYFNAMAIEALTALFVILRIAQTGSSSQATDKVTEQIIIRYKHIPHLHIVAFSRLVCRERDKMNKQAT